ncbi:hypothetical protein HMPREF9141_0248 [Prevotella multiformis DSM 16608]|uniref:Uncharacterized protein n=1 Tax=Prevotella multiformis DSM 16608 TaxID=888743 RepID=F0F3T2_9BACT|nr:hypothetical protein HMPREF9141_0248 [Prevotella multiformis DSM 16608]
MVRLSVDKGPFPKRRVKLAKVLQISKEQTSQIKKLYVDLDFL